VYRASARPVHCDEDVGYWILATRGGRNIFRFSIYLYYRCYNNSVLPFKCGAF